MKVIIVALAFVALAVAAPAKEDEVVQIVRSEFNQQPEGAYNFGFESANGIVREETGEVKVVPDEENKPHPVVVVRGSYSYPDSNGKVDTINYYADETGYHAEGPSIPKNERR